MQNSIDIKTTTSKSEYLTLLPMCDDNNRETITDMFNPIYIGYQLFKRGFCLAYNNGDLNKEQKNSYPKMDDDNFNEVTSNNNPDPSLKEPSSWTNTLPQFAVSNGQPFEPLTDLSTFPVLSPNGLCIDNAAHILFLKNKKVTCSYLLNKFECPTFNTRFLSYIKAEQTVVNYIITDGILNGLESDDGKVMVSTISVTSGTSSCNNVIKKIEIIYLVKKVGTVYTISSRSVNIYYISSVEINDNKYVDITFEASFQNEEEYVQRSGNPGYLPSSDIITGKYTTDEAIHVAIHKTKKIFGILSDGTCLLDSNDNKLFYNDNLDNSLTFENGIIFGCKILQSSTERHNSISLYKMIYNLESDDTFRFSIMGQPNERDVNFIPLENNGRTVTLDKEKLASSAQNYIPNLNFLYAEVGATNNTQNAIIAFRADDTLNVDRVSYNDGYIPKYLKINFFKQPLEKKWWYASGPGFIKLPRNVMYPFRIGTTTYKKSSSK